MLENNPIRKNGQHARKYAPAHGGYHLASSFLRASLRLIFPSSSRHSGFLPGKDCFHFPMASGRGMHRICGHNLSFYCGFGSNIYFLLIFAIISTPISLGNGVACRMGTNRRFAFNTAVALLRPQETQTAFISSPKSLLGRFPGVSRKTHRDKLCALRLASQPAIDERDERRPPGKQTNSRWVSSW